MGGGSLVESQMAVAIQVCFWILELISLFSVSVLMLTAHCFDHCSFVVSSKVSKCELCTLVLLCGQPLWCLSFFQFSNWSLLCGCSEVPFVKLKMGSTASLVSSMEEGWHVSDALCATVEMITLFFPSGVFYQ